MRIPLGILHCYPRLCLGIQIIHILSSELVTVVISISLQNPSDGLKAITGICSHNNILNCKITTIFYHGVQLQYHDKCLTATYLQLTATEICPHCCHRMTPFYQVTNTASPVLNVCLLANIRAISHDHVPTTNHLSYHRGWGSPLQNRKISPHFRHSRLPMIPYHGNISNKSSNSNRRNNKISNRDRNKNTNCHSTIRVT